MFVSKTIYLTLILAITICSGLNIKSKTNSSIEDRELEPKSETIDKSATFALSAEKLSNSSAANFTSKLAKGQVEKEKFHDEAQTATAVEDILLKIFDDIEQEAEEEDKNEDDEAEEEEEVKRSDVHVESNSPKSVVRKTREIGDAGMPRAIPHRRKSESTRPQRPRQPIPGRTPANKNTKTNPRPRPANQKQRPSKQKNRPSRPRPGPSHQVQSDKVSSLAKYNDYVDAVLARMNSLVKKKRMDPLRVNLYSGKKAPKGRMDIEDEADDVDADLGLDQELDPETNDETQPTAVRDIELEERQIRALLQNSTVHSDGWEFLSEEGRATKPKTSNKTNATATISKSKGSSKHKQSTKVKANKRPAAPRPTRGILHGLSTLRRDGNVQVIKDGRKAKIVRAKFLLGPVALEIQPKKSKSAAHAPAPEPIRATAPQLKGVIEIRLSPVSPTRIRALKVYPPGGKVQVNSGSGGTSNYKSIQPQATARLRQAAIEVLAQVDHKMKIH